MNINIYLEDFLAEEITAYSKNSGKTRNAVIREALKTWLKIQKKKQWPKAVLQYKGCPDWPPFESYRDELNPPKEDPFA